MRPDESNGRVWKKNGRGWLRMQPPHVRPVIETVGAHRAAQLRMDALQDAACEQWDQEHAAMDAAVITGG